MNERVRFDRGYFVGSHSEMCHFGERFEQAIFQLVEIIVEQPQIEERFKVMKRGRMYLANFVKLQL